MSQLLPPPPRVSLTNLPFLEELEKKLGHTFKDRTLLVCALIHATPASRILERTAGTRFDDNAVFGYIGDGILHAVVRLISAERYPQASFAFMQSACDVLVSNASFAYVARTLNLAMHILLPLDYVQALQSELQPWIRFSPPRTKR